jgi:hypothetical protein
MVATSAVRLLPAYRFDPRSGLWRHRHAPAPPVGLRRLLDGRPSPSCQGRSAGPRRRARPVLRQAEAIFAARPSSNGAAPAATMFDEFDRLRWFELPEACLEASASKANSSNPD